MMYEPEKSDSAVVAVWTNASGIRRGKPANKTERSVAEPVEREAGAEGNAEQVDTLRKMCIRDRPTPKSIRRKCSTARPVLARRRILAACC